MIDIPWAVVLEEVLNFLQDDRRSIEDRLEMAPALIRGKIEMETRNAITRQHKEAALKKVRFISPPDVDSQKPDGEEKIHGKCMSLIRNE